MLHLEMEVPLSDAEMMQGVSILLLFVRASISVRKLCNIASRGVYNGCINQPLQSTPRTLTCSVLVVALVKVCACAELCTCLDCDMGAVYAQQSITWAKPCTLHPAPCTPPLHPVHRPLLCLHFVSNRTIGSTAWPRFPWRRRRTLSTATVFPAQVSLWTVIWC